MTENTTTTTTDMIVSDAPTAEVNEIVSIDSHSKVMNESNIVDQSLEVSESEKTVDDKPINQNSNSVYDRSSPQLQLSDDEMRMFEHLAKLDYETEKKKELEKNPESLDNSSSNFDEEALIHNQINVSNIVENEEYTITTNYTITTTHPLGSVNINTSVASENSSTDENIDTNENRIEVPVEVSISPRELGRSIIPGLNALRGSTKLPSPPLIEDHQIHDDEDDDFHDISLGGNDTSPQKRKRDANNESFDYECNVWCFAQPISYLFTQLFSNENELDTNVNNKEIQV